MLVAILAIALGVAMGLGINLVNRSALNEFDNALSQVNGQAQYRLTTANNRIDDKLLLAVESDRSVSAASPVVTIEALLADSPDSTKPKRLRILGLDVFRAATVAPALLPRADTSTASGAASPLFGDDSVFLSAAALRLSGRAIGDKLNLLVNGRNVTLHISGDVPGADNALALAVMDIAAAQWKLGWLNRLSHIDLQLVPGTNPDSLLARLSLTASGDGASLRLERPDAGTKRMSNLSRAYRINLNVLALVALLTGGFIVFASLELAIVRMMPMLSLVGVLGAPPALRAKLVLMIALLLGVIGSLLGTALGIALAWLLLGLVGGDLGGGFFASTRPALQIPIGTLILFIVLGLVAAVAGALSPALKLQRLVPAQALKDGQAIRLSGQLSPLAVSALLALTGTVLLFVPAIDGLPLAAYLAIACWLFAGVLIVGPLLGYLAHALAARSEKLPDTLTWLAVTRLDSAHQAAFPALAGVVASFALVSSMAIMVYSFRVSVDDWLQAILPADLYVRVATNSNQAAFEAGDRQVLSSVEGVQSVSFLRSVELLINPELAPLVLLARPIDTRDPGATLPLTGALFDMDKRDARCTMVYASEPASRLYGWQTGDSIDLPLPYPNDTTPCYQVRGIWRDYARQQGAIAIDLTDYRRISGDMSVSDASVWLDKSAEPDQTTVAIRQALPELPGLQIRSAASIRALSLHIFDRSFAVTYALEAVALLVGLFGVATTYSGEALARIREFGMLRHLGMTRLQLARLFASESLLSISFGVIWGAFLGGLISQVLIHRVNPQSFNWTMRTHWPIGMLLFAALSLITLGVATAIFAARHAAGRAPIAAVRADW